MNNRRLLLAGVIISIFVITTLAAAIAFTSNYPNSSLSPHSPTPTISNINSPNNSTSTPSPTASSTRNPNVRINQVQIRVQYNTTWVGLYGEPNFTKQNWNGTSERTAVINRPDGVSQWIIVTNTQGFAPTRQNVALTVSILDMSGQVIATKSSTTAIIILNVDIDNPEKEVIYDFWSDTAITM
jgi:hypothetical protein